MLIQCQKKLGSAEIKPIAPIQYCTRWKNIETGGSLVQNPSTGNWEAVGVIYGHISEFDLSNIEGYRDFIFGENIMAMTAIINSSQENVNYRVFLTKEVQSNVTSFNMDACKITDFNFPQDDTLGEGVSCRAIYNISNGKLYIVCAHTGKISCILLYKI